MVVTAPTPRKQKKQTQKEAEKAAKVERKAKEKKERRRQGLLKNTRAQKQAKAPSRPGRTAQLMSVEDALRVLAAN